MIKKITSIILSVLMFSPYLMADNIDTSELWNPSTGEVISAASYQSDINVIKNTINGDIDSENIENGSIVNADISAAADIAPSKISTGSTDGTLDDFLQNYISGCDTYRSGTTTVSTSEGAMAIGSRYFYNTSDITSTVTAANDWYYIWAIPDGSTEKWTTSVATSSATSGNTPERLIAAVRYGASSVREVINFRDGEIYGWGYQEGDDSDTISETVYLGGENGAITIDDTANSFYYGSATGDAGTEPSEPINNNANTLVSFKSATTDQFEMKTSGCDSAILESGTYYLYTWHLKASHSAMPSE